MRQNPHGLLMCENPIVGRSAAGPAWFRALLVAAVLLCVDPAHAQQAVPRLTEADVIRLARERTPDSVVADATVALADARERTAGLRANPLVGWDRESLVSGPGSSQDVLRATLPLDLAGPRTHRSLVASESAWIRAEASLSRTGAVLDALLAYYDVVALEQRADILEQAVASLYEATRVLARREAAGAVSGYESTRLALALELARSRVAEARGELAGARAHLAGVLGLEAAGLEVDTALALAVLPGADELVQNGAAARGVMAHAHSSVRLAAEADERAAWTWLPTLELSGGANVERDDADTRYGYVVGLSLSVPMFDRGQGLRAEARALRALSLARSEALARSLARDVASAYATYAAARAELDRFEQATQDPVEALSSAVESGYREGQRTIVELIDAQGVRTEVLERRAELLIAAKRAEARVRAAGGLL